MVAILEKSEHNVDFHPIVDFVKASPLRKVPAGFVARAHRDVGRGVRNCSVSWQGQYGRGDKKYPTIMLEAVASQDLWIWHAFYGIVGVNNDINILDNSPLFDNLLDDLAPAVSYVVNGVEYRNGYYLADGIYPESMQTMWIDRCETQRRKAKELRDIDTHISLQQNLMNHIWREVEEASEED
nr:protein ALP1-like isoform X1 [Tanacetum cinerariifolium]